jgi:hypothetical protein
MTPTEPAWPLESTTDDAPIAVRETLPIRRRSRRASSQTIGLVVAFAASVGFLVGVELEKGQAGTSAGTGATTGQFAAFAGARGAGTAASGATGTASGAAGATSAAAGGTTGKVTLVDGQTVYLTDSQGNAVKVITSPSTTITKPGAITDLKPGDTIIVRGQTGTDGTLTAVSVTDSGTTAASPGAAGRPTNSGTGGGTATTVPASPSAGGRTSRSTPATGG